MNVLIEKAKQVKHNGGGAYADVCGRGLKHRVFDSNDDRFEEAADVATGVRRYVPTLNETAQAYGVSVSELRKHLNARAAALHDREAAIFQARVAVESAGAQAFVDLWDAYSESQKIEAFKRIGPAAVWDVLVKIVT